MTIALYNEIEPFAADTLENLIDAGLIAPGIVDRRSIEDLTPEYLSHFTQVHFFAGLGAWSYALRQAGVSDDTPLWTGSCPCFPAGTLIFTDRGQKTIEDVRIGDTVLTHKGRWRKVTATGSEVSDTVTVKGQGHWGMECTPDHPFLTGHDEWTNAKDLTGKRWRTVASVPSAPIPEFTPGYGVAFIANAWRVTGWKDGTSVYVGRYKTEELARAARKDAEVSGRINVRGADSVDVTSLAFARFLGMWVGDGWCSGNNVLLCSHINQATRIQQVMKDADMTASLSIERTSSRVRCGSKALVAWLTENFGSTANGKNLPAWIHGQSEEYRSAFLAGYSEADGHVDTGGHRRWTTVSRALAIGVRTLLNQSGISASIKRTESKRNLSIEGREVNERPLYVVTGYESARSFSFGGIHGAGLVRSVTPSGTRTVYNLSVEEDETYVADGIVVHNCQPFSSAGKGDGFDDERHLWPAWFWLIEQCRPERLFGEQVASKDANPWVALVQADLEGLGYAFGAVPFTAAGVGAPNIRERLYWMADADQGRWAQAGLHPTSNRATGNSGAGDWPSDGSSNGEPLRLVGLADANGGQSGNTGSLQSGGEQRLEPQDDRIGERLAHPQNVGDQPQGRPAGHRAGSSDSGSSTVDHPWRDADWLYCRDARWRPVEPGTFPLAHGLARGMGSLDARLSELASVADLDAASLRDAKSYRVGSLKAYGNAINAVAATEFIRACMTTTT